ncbi:MAG: DNA mismatch repair endonuclease MutL [Flavobacteriales bacterium]|nr:DNA mismatch repair endonuclease MutL [Flavobacteriales bacterium]
MSDIIQLLPDAVANQIAAGEVIQRPASVVKELVENAIDAGSTEIKLIVKDSGKTLIQVVDNGCGMSEMDARMSFQKHATSKIRLAEDLFALRTKGFRGEALASIAAVAQVELKTRLAHEDLGTHIAIENSDVSYQEPCQTHTGSSFIVKNLFFNVPARRQFLKSEAVELRHIIDEFERVALVHEEVAFQLIHNGNELFNLPPASSRQRIVGVFGAKFNQRLVPVEEHTDIVGITGFVGKPEFARKTRGEQFFFVNKRYIKSSYLNHAITTAFDELLPKGMHPFFVLFLELEPDTIDVNVHPTKTEIKFRDERAIYAMIHAAVRRSLGRYNVAPTLDFDQEMSIKIDPIDPSRPVTMPSIKVNPDFNPFTRSSAGGSSGGSSMGGGGYKPDSLSRWQSLYEVVATPQEPTRASALFNGTEEENHERKPLFQMQNRFVVTPIKSGLMLIDQQLAHERILYERYLSYLESSQGPSQQLLFPETVEMSRADYHLISERLSDIRRLGFDVEDFGGTTFKVNGIPVDSTEDNAEVLLDGLVDQIRQADAGLSLEPRQLLALGMARTSGMKKGKKLNDEEMHHLVDELFACEVPYFSPGGNATIATFTLEEIITKFH